MLTVYCRRLRIHLNKTANQLVNKMKAQFKTWKANQQVIGKYMGMVEYQGTINDSRSRYTPDGTSFIFVVTLTKEFTLFGKLREVGSHIEIWENSDDTIEVVN